MARTRSSPPKDQTWAYWGFCPAGGGAARQRIYSNNTVLKRSFMTGILSERQCTDLRLQRTRIGRTRVSAWRRSPGQRWLSPPVYSIQCQTGNFTYIYIYIIHCLSYHLSSAEDPNQDPMAPDNLRFQGVLPPFLMQFSLFSFPFLMCSLHLLHLAKAYQDYFKNH